MKVTMIYPDYPESFWSFEHALSFIGKKSAHPPLGLLTVAALLPDEWEKKVIDLNVNKLKEQDIKWADYVFISAMVIQRDSVKEIIKWCKSLGVKTVVGGPLFTMEPEEFKDVDHMVLNEAEITLPEFLDDLSKGTPKHIYNNTEKPGLEKTPVPRWDLINMNDYVTMSIQYSRGCPFDCEFCDITSLFGREQRLKTKAKMLDELEAIYERGWRGSVFIVDDNFIGNKGKLKREVLPGIIEWMEIHDYPFIFITEASINLADDEELMDMMRKAGFVNVFVGIETPDEESLKECNKYANINRNLVSSVKKIQNYGMEVSGGFIVGFDSDTTSIFDRQIKFIQESGIVTAMVGLLNAPKGTRLYERLKNENRLLSKQFSGNNTDYSLNFVPKMNRQTLINGYKKIVTTIYDPPRYYERILEFFKEFKPEKKYRHKTSVFHFVYLKAFFKAMFYLGVLEKGRQHYWKMLLKTLAKYPRYLPDAIIFAVYGFHFRRVFDNDNAQLSSAE
ncbi:MAG: B12-binding domain-containing radical SAM protein [Clostridiales bacterium]|nr:B12-binding domain-containing radical SAM protein [Clostridiales bacterium]MCF8021601.1 B12-binding domain-containing radical SAM protein [Clostridiales bacterium]